MQAVFIKICFPVGAIQYCSISETITSMEYVTMFFYKAVPGTSVTLLQGACAFLWLDNIACTGKKRWSYGTFLGELWQNLFRVKVLRM
jgi:hypothetical protein